tara:strand:- start:67 stop:648 length:582 start_codon:yes stop_codon:yes gene_type:complete
MWEKHYITKAEKDRRQKIADKKAKALAEQEQKTQLKKDELKSERALKKEKEDRKRSVLHIKRCEKYYACLKKEREQTKTQLIENSGVSLATFNKDQPIFLEMYAKNDNDPTKPYVEFRKPMNKNKKKFFLLPIKSKANSLSLFSGESVVSKKLNKSDISDKEWNERLEIIRLDKVERTPNLWKSGMVNGKKKT